MSLSNYFDKVPVAMKNPRVLFCDVNTYLQGKVFDLYVVNKYTRQLVGHDQKVLEMQKADIDELNDFLTSFQMTHAWIFAMGAGTVIDVTKYLCFKTNSAFSFIPSALSTNSFATHRNSFFDKEKKKVSFNSVVADEIIVDFDLIKQAYILNKFGLVEIASTATAQIDCDIAHEHNNEVFDETLRERARHLIEGTQLVMPEDVGKNDTLEKLLYLLLESGALTREQGNGRMVSGSEHVISSYIESEQSCPHGMGLLFGIMIASELQNNAGYSNKHVATIIELLKKDSDIRAYIEKNFTQTQILSALKRVRPRLDKFTVLDITPTDQLLDVGSRIIRNYFNNV